MRHLEIALLLAIAVAGCDARELSDSTSTANPPGAENAANSTSLASVPPPAVSHVVDTSPGETPSASAHHAETPLAAPEIDPVTVAPERAPTAATAAATAVREITVPAGTTLSLQLGTAISSDGSNVEDPVQATLRRAVVVNGTTVIPAGAAVSGYVSEAARSARVKGRARVGVRFSALRVDGSRYTIRTTAVTREARGTKKADATKIGIGAGAGAVVGAIAGGKKGAAVGTAVGAAGGTGVVLATRGEEVSLPAGTTITARLSQPVTIRIH